MKNYICTKCKSPLPPPPKKWSGHLVKYCKCKSSYVDYGEWRFRNMGGVWMGGFWREIVKVYCEDCKFYQGKIYLRFSTFPDQCKAPKNKEKKDTYLKIRTILKKKPSVLNKNNDCPHYERKWWKFWIEGD